MIKKLNTAPILALSESQYSQYFLEYSHLIFKTGPIRPILRYHFYERKTLFKKRPMDYSFI